MDLPGRGDVNPYGIPMPNPHEQEQPWDDYDACIVCGDYSLNTRCDRCARNMDEDRERRERGA